MSDLSNPVERIVVRFGGQSALARLLGVGQSTVWGWINLHNLTYARIAEIIAVGKRQKPPIRLRPNDFFALD